MSTAEDAIKRGHFLIILSFRALAVGVFHSSDHGGDDHVRYLILDDKDVLQVAIIGLRPHSAASISLDQLRRHPNSIAGLAHTTVDNMGDTQFTGSSHCIQSLFSGDKGGCDGDYEEALEPGQAGDNILCQPVGEIALLRITAFVFER